MVAVPVALLAALAVGALAPPQQVAARAFPRPIDLPGLSFLAAFLVSLLLGLRGLEGGRPESLAILAAPFLLALFVLTELRTEHPAVDPRLFA